MKLKCPICGKLLHLKYGQMHCECGWADPTYFKPMANACRKANSHISH